MQATTLVGLNLSTYTYSKLSKQTKHSKHHFHSNSIAKSILALAQVHIHHPVFERIYLLLSWSTSTLDMASHKGISELRDDT